MAMSPNQKLALYGVVGLGATVLALLAFSGNANAATNTPAPAPSGMSPTDNGRGQAATALAAAIQAAGGLCATEANAVILYEQAAGLTVDAGYPGTNVITALRADLATMGTTSSYPVVGTVGLYAWTSSPGWVAGNVPSAYADGSGAAWTASATTCPTSGIT